MSSPSVRHPPLAYSTNLHPAETIAEVVDRLTSFAAPIREELGWDRLGLDLRLGAVALRELADPDLVQRLRSTLDRLHLSAHTLNCFPLGTFQADIVKRDAYLPDWTTSERLDLTLAAIPIALALSDDPEPTISTVPGTYRPLANGPEVAATVAAALGRWAAAAALAAREHDRHVVLCLEPEPWCLLETSHDVAAFWSGPLATAGLDACTAILGERSVAQAALARHLGVCVDTCHLSLAFDEPAAAVQRMRAAGARIAKCQISAAPEVAHPAQDPDGVAELQALAEPRFLHQTAARRGASLTKGEDLDQLGDVLARLPGAEIVRSHFHIPLFREPTERGLSTTIRESLHGLAACRAAGCTHLAVETYTWSILAARERDARAGTVRELAFLRGAIDGYDA